MYGASIVSHTQPPQADVLHGSYGIDKRGRVIPYRSSKPAYTHHIPDVHTDDLDVVPKPTRTRLSLPISPSWKEKKRLLFLVGGALTLGGLLLCNVVSSITSSINAQWHYGDAKVSYAAFTENGQREEVLATCYQGRIVLVILPEDTTQASQVYPVPQIMLDKNSHSITIETKDINADGKTDIVLHIDGNAGSVLYKQSDGSYSWQAPKENSHE